ncbi:MAG: hypothetical protein MZV64_47735 [Ignavibacteriales bacterium]|nr:hypothetical protein [Ignavibacteriales bacterium]
MKIKLHQVYIHLHEEDPSFYVKFDPEISQTIISGQGELTTFTSSQTIKRKI